MASNNGAGNFPEAEAKLHKTTKTSIFEKHKAEAEAKRQREAVEAAAALESFVKSFDDNDDDGRSSYRHRDRGGFDDSHPSPSSRFQNTPTDRPNQFALGGGTGKRHFGVPAGATGLKSGPGSLGPPPTSFGKRRPYDESPSGGSRTRGDERGVLGYDVEDKGSSSIVKAFDASDDEAEPTATGRAEEKAVSKPTLRLAHLPPATSPAVVEALMPPNLTVEGVKIMGSAGQSGTERKSLSAIVTLSQETPATDMDAAVSALQNRYLGFGFYLNIHRHLSSATISSTALPGLGTSAGSTLHPFGAKRVKQSDGPQSHQPYGRGRAFAPPPSYGPGAGGAVNRNAILHVPIQPPTDVKKLRAIHKVAEAVLEYGPEFEALLMSRPEVQREEKWSWLWDARSEGGVWYRWRLWEIVTGSRHTRGQGKFVPLFEGSHAWKVPEQPLPYEYAAELNEFVSDSEYNSDNDEDLDDEPARQADGTAAANAEQEDTFLNPIEQFKLVHMLARLPTTLARLRKGDIARVTSFAITHASRGADEIVNLIISNVERPFAYTSANPSYRRERKEKRSVDEHSDSDSHDAPRAEATAGDSPDMSTAQLVGLYVVSDILSSASAGGIRHAWRYRQLIENALRARTVFETLGCLAERMNWGRLRADKWKRSIGLVLSLWEGWCVFHADTQAFFASSFENPPCLKKAEKTDEEQKKGKWKTVDEAAAPVADDPMIEDTAGADHEAEGGDEVQQAHRDETDAEEYSEYTDDEDIDLDALELEDIDGDPVIDAHIYYKVDSDSDMELDADERREQVASSAPPPEVKSIGGFAVAATTVKPRKRMRASDMFAESRSDGGQE